MYDYQNDYIMTTDDLCAELGISRNTAYALLSKNKIRGWQIGRSWRTTRSALIEYITNECNKK